jgi:translation elongation factor EF-G
MSQDVSGFRETVTTSAEARGRFVKQSSEPAMYGDAWLRVEPLERGKGFEFVNALAEGIIPPEYIQAVEAGVREEMRNGVLQSHPMTDLRVTLFDGSSHPVDSSWQAFMVAGAIGFHEAALQAHPIVLESFRETITASAEARGSHIHQASGPGNYGVVWLRVEPLARGQGFEFVNALDAGVIPERFIWSVEQGVREAVADGGPAGYLLVDLRVTLFNGAYHEVDSREMDFKIAAARALKAAVEQAQPILLAL